MNVSWKSPPLIHHNGKLTGYIIQYTSIKSNGTINVRPTIETTMISRLVKSVKYSVTVAAINVNGTGPFSNPVVQKPTKRGRLFIYVHHKRIVIVPSSYYLLWLL